MPKNRFAFGFELMEKAEKEADRAEIMIYSTIVSSKWREDDPEITAKEFDKLLKEAKNSGASKLTLRINSPGGSVWQAVAMRTMLENSSFEEIRIDIEGVCASAATFFVCVPGVHVRISEGSEFMIHNPSSIAWGTASEMIHQAERMQKMERDQHAMYARRCGKDEAQIKQWMDDETWFTAREAVEAGFCDEISNAAAVAACAGDVLELMQDMYRRVPDGVRCQREPSPVARCQREPSPVAKVGNASLPDASEIKPDKEENEMNLSEVTMEQLQAENPELFESIRQQGVTEERERMAEIDALTDEGFEELAQEAKANGTAAADFLKQVVSQRQGKKKAFLDARKDETGAAQQVAGGAAADNDGDDGDEIARNAREMAELAKGLNLNGASMY